MIALRFIAISLVATALSHTPTRPPSSLSRAEPGDLVINEILYQPTYRNRSEFVELYNRTLRPIDLEGWELGDASAIARISGPLILAEGAFLYLSGDPAFASIKSNGYHLPGMPSLNDSGDALYIRSPRGLTVDSLFYHGDWGGGRGYSLERLDPDAASNDPANWETSRSQGGISAGNINGSYRPDTEPPRLLFCGVRHDGTLAVQFNEFIRTSPLPLFSVDGKQVEVARFDPRNANRIELIPPSARPLQRGEHRLVVSGLSDYAGNISPDNTIPVAFPPTPGDLVINEIMYEPRADPFDYLPDQSEYLELVNTRGIALSAEGLYLHGRPDEENRVSPLHPVNSRGRYLPGNGFLLFYPEGAGSTFAHSRVARSFRLTGLDPLRTVRVNRETLGFSTAGDAVYLADSSGTVIDSVFYRPGWHNPNLIETRGIALERIYPAGRGNDASNWSSSADPRGGTPAEANSIRQRPATPPDRTGLQITPPSFSPDGDGREDLLFIQYRLDHPDYLLNVRIFDRYGRQVRQLANGEPAGREGFLQWDGRTDEGQRNRVGIYIILFQAYDSAGGRTRTFRETAVLSRHF